MAKVVKIIVVNNRVSNKDVPISKANVPDPTIHPDRVKRCAKMIADANRDSGVAIPDVDVCADKRFNRDVVKANGVKDNSTNNNYNRNRLWSDWAVAVEVPH